MQLTQVVARSLLARLSSVSDSGEIIMTPMSLKKDIVQSGGAFPKKKKKWVRRQSAYTEINLIIEM